MRDDIRIVLVGTKSRLVWDHLAGNYKISLWPVQWLSVSILSFWLTEEYIDEAYDLRISKLKRCFIGGEKEQNFQELGRKKSFTRPDCR